MNQKNLIQKLEQIKMLSEKCLKELSAHPSINLEGIKKTISSKSKIPHMDLDFQTPIRPFIKKYAKGLSGPKKIVLLLAWLTKGNEGKEVSLIEIRTQWNKMKAHSLLNLKFNRFFSARAQENDWIERSGKGMYRLRPSWRDIFQ